MRGCCVGKDSEGFCDENYFEELLLRRLRICKVCLAEKDTEGLQCLEGFQVDCYFGKVLICYGLDEGYCVRRILGAFKVEKDL